MSDITAYMMQIDEAKDKRAIVQKRYDQANSRYRSGLLAILLSIIGVIIILFVYSNFLCIAANIFVFLIGLLTTATNYATRRAEQTKIAEFDKFISDMRQHIVTMSDQ